MRIEIRRRGGLAGIPLRADFDTAQLESHAAARVEEAIGRLLTTPATVSTAQPDAFEYEISVPARGDSVLVGERELPSDLQPLIEQLSTVGHVDAPKRSGPIEPAQGD